MVESESTVKIMLQKKPAMILSNALAPLTCQWDITVDPDIVWDIIARKRILSILCMVFICLVLK